MHWLKQQLNKITSSFWLFVLLIALIIDLTALSSFGSGFQLNGSIAKPKRILFVSFNVGFGHLAIERAIKETIQNAWGTQVQMASLEVMSTLPKYQENFIRNTYFGILNHSPSIYNRLFTHVAESNPVLDQLTKKIVSQIANAKMKLALEQSAPDLIVSTHPWSTLLINEINSNLPNPAKILTVNTDFVLIHGNLTPGTMVYPSASLAQEAIALGRLPRHTRSTSGLPARPRFYNIPQHEELRNKLGINPKATHILVSGGGDGFALKKIKSFLTQYRPTMPVHLTVLCGRSAEVKHSFDQALKNATGTFTWETLGFIDNVEDYFHSADLVFSKPGGSTIAEAMAVGKPILVHDTLPGHERKNIEFFQETGLVSTVELNALNDLPSLLLHYRKLQQKLNLNFPDRLHIPSEILGIIAEQLWLQPNLNGSNSIAGCQSFLFKKKKAS